MKLQFSWQFSEKYSNIKFHENPSSGSRVVPCKRTDGRTDERTDTTKLKVAFRNFASEPKNCMLCPHSVFVCFVFNWEQTTTFALYDKLIVL